MIRASKLRLILFDIDGTLLRASGVGRDAKRAAMLEIFGTDTGIDAHEFGGKTDWYSLLEMLTRDGYTPEEIRDRLPEFSRSMGQHMERMIGDYTVTACPGAHAAVERLKQQRDVILGIVTGNLATTAPVKLRAAGFDPAWFPVSAYGNEAIDRNDLPPLALQRAVARSGQRITPQQVIIVGDTPYDVNSARALGAHSVAVMTGYSNRESLEASGPDYVLSDLTHLFDIPEIGRIIEGENL